jgi:hypothetical protein
MRDLVEKTCQEVAYINKHSRNLIACIMRSSAEGFYSQIFQWKRESKSEDILPRRYNSSGVKICIILIT